MPEYEKLTVAKLREELVKRGLPKTGLKAVLIQRLVKADEQATQAEPETADAEVVSTYLNGVEESVSPIAEPSEQTKPAKVPNGGIQKSSAPPASVVPLQKPPLTEPETHDTPSVARRASGIEIRIPAIDGADESSGAEATIKLSKEEPGNQTTSAATLQDDVTEVNAGEEPQIAVSTTMAETTMADHTPAPSVSRQDSLNAEEALEDTRKRKRRSVTPPPSAESVQKKARIHNVTPHVKLPEDESMSDVVAPSSEDTPMPNPTPTQESTRVADVAIENPFLLQDGDAPSTAEDKIDDPSPNPISEPTHQENGGPNAIAETVSRQRSPEDEYPTAANQSAKPPPETSPKTSPSDTRFKNLLPSSSRRGSSPNRHSTKADEEDRIVSPALHPATTALYVRDILRPLHLENLKDHLISLATPLSNEPDPTIIEDFFLDSIRTHCLVRFSTTAAASRVRTGLHDRVWPDEKNRKPLWVDFVPEEKLSQWFEVENASSGRGQAAKRWEVVYENEDDGVKAYLQEVGSNSGGLRKVQPAAPRPENRPGVRGAPVAPRLREHDQDDAQRRPGPDRGRGFQALDDLFKSTSAKPKLYYLPVPQRTADNRLDLLAEGRGGGRNDEMRRYSFEEGILVDRGPEFGSRGRGGFGARGGSYRGYSGRGGGFREDYRSDYRGDHRGDYRPDYRRDRR
ncbi:MAG: hypothetical protein Q9218_001164 [Villophora microphyllina]